MADQRAVSLCVRHQRIYTVRPEFTHGRFALVALTLVGDEQDDTRSNRLAVQTHRAGDRRQIGPAAYPR